MQHRLSKPRTNTNSLSVRNEQTSNHSTPSKPSSRGTDGSSKHSESNDDPFSPLAQDSPLSLSGEAYQPYNVSKSENTLLNASTNSTTSLNSSNAANRTSLADLADIDVGAAIALLQELKKRASPEDLVALHKALLPSRSNEAELQSSIPEAEGREEAFSPLIRRSSMLPAGVATRMSSEQMKKYSGRNTSTQRQSSRSRSRPAQREKSPDSEPMPAAVETVDFADESHERQAGRTATPSDFTYTGTYRIGSLRITNGAASPDPSVMLSMAEQIPGSRTASYESMAGDGFVTADEGDNNTEPTTPACHNVRGSPKWARARAGSIESIPRSRPRTAAPLKVNTVRDSSADEMFRPSAQTPSRPHHRHHASDMADHYTEECELPSSPYAEDGLHASRLSTVEDSSPVDVHAGGPEEALQRLTGGGPQLEGRISLGSESSASRTELDDRAHLKVNRPSMHTKSDSGYDSASSWQAQARAMIKRSKVDDALKYALEAADKAELDRSKHSPPGPVHRSSLEHQRQRSDVAAVVPPVAMARPLLGGQWAEKHNSMPVFSHPPLDASAVPVPKVSPKGNAVDKTSPAVTPTKQSKKLQKGRPQSQQHSSSMTVQSIKEPVPSVPDTASFNFSRRINRAPGMSHLDHTFGSVDHTSSESAEAARPTQVSETLEKLNEATDTERPGRGRGRQQSKTEAKDAESPPLEKRRSFFRLRGRSRSKSRKRSSGEFVQKPTEEDPMPTISDFGTVAQSLGSSPYDIATRKSRSMSGTSRSDEPRRVFHPHEISNALGGPVVGMDDATAAEFARMKSQKRAEQHEQHERERSQSRSRPRHVADCAVTPERQQSPATPAGPSTANSGRSRSGNRRSASAHTTTLSRIPSLPESGAEATASTSKQASATPANNDQVHVGTIEIAGGVAQGRMFSNNKRRSQSATPRSRSPASAPKVEEVEEIPQIPKLPIPTTNAVVEAKATDLPVQNRSTAERKSSKLPTPKKEVMIEAETPSSPTHDAKHPGWPGWENQARLWRERRKSLGEALTPASARKTSHCENLSPASANTTQRYTPTKEAPRHSPAIVVSRYITPTGAELVAGTEEAKENDPYRALHSVDPTEHLPAQDDVDRTDSAISSSTYRTADSSKSQDSQGSTGSRHSASYRAYRPADAVPMSSMTSSPPRDAQGRAKALQRRSTAPPENPDAIFDRYSGGLNYGWDRDNGFGGSAGTRAKHDTKGERKSVVLSEAYGVDLSDVPVFLRRS